MKSSCIAFWFYDNCMESVILCVIHLFYKNCFGSCPITNIFTNFVKIYTKNLIAYKQG